MMDSCELAVKTVPVVKRALTFGIVSPARNPARKNREVGLSKRRRILAVMLGDDQRLRNAWDAVGKDGHQRRPKGKRLTGREVKLVSDQPIAGSTDRKISCSLSSLRNCTIG